MVEIVVQHIDREGDNSPEITIDSEIENIHLIRELKAYLALHHPVPIPSTEQILLDVTDETLLLDEDMELNTISTNAEEMLDIFMYRKLTNEFVSVVVEISDSFVDVDRSELQVLITCDMIVSQLKAIIRESRGIPLREQVLVTMGNNMDNNNNLGEYMVELLYQPILCNKAEADGSVPVPAISTDEETSGTTTTTSATATEDEKEDADEDDNQ